MPQGRRDGGGGTHPIGHCEVLTPLIFSSAYRTGPCRPLCSIKGRVLRPYHTGLCKPLCWRGAPGLGPRCWRLPADTGLPTRALVPQSLRERRAGHEEAGNGWADSRLPASRVQRALVPVPAHGLRAQGWLQVDDTGLPPPARVTQSLHERRAEDPVLGREGADARLPPCSQKRGRGTAKKPCAAGSEENCPNMHASNRILLSADS